MAREIICGIYCIFNKVNHKRYIGQSSDIIRRWNQHKNILSSRKKLLDNIHLMNAWQKYGVNNFDFFIVERCAISELDALEMFWINYYDSANPAKGYNKTQGGKYYNKNRQGHLLSEQDVLKIIDLFENKESNTSIAKQFNISKTSVAYIRKHKSWAYLTNGLDIQHSNFYDTHEFANGTAKPIDVYTLNGDFIKTFPSIIQAATELKIANSSIIKVCYGKQISAKKYIFRFHGCDFNMYKTKKTPDVKSVPVDQYDLNWNYIQSFNSINEAFIATGIYGIRFVLSNPAFTRGKYHWLRKGERPPKEEIYKTSRWVAVNQYDSNWNLIASYPSLKHASLETNISTSCICNVLSGRRKTAGGFYWDKNKEIC